MLRFSRPALLALFLTAGSVYGASQRSFVKSTGVDTLPGSVPNACSLASPCRSFAAALLQTLPGGEVIVLDSAGYGAVTIGQSVSIIAPSGVYAGITPSSFNAILVNGPGIVVVLQGLSINGLGSGGTGIDFSQGAELHVRNCSIAGMIQDGISANAAGGRLYVSDTTIRKAGGGITLTGAITGTLDRVHVEDSDSGVTAFAGASVSVRESVVSNNTVSGVDGEAQLGVTTRITIDSTLITDIGGSGAFIFADTAGDRATLDIIRTTLMRSSLSGADAATTAGVVLMTVTSNVISGNAAAGITGLGTGTTILANGNLISSNVVAGIRQLPNAAIHTRSNNSGEQVPATMGTVTPVPGF
jgi:hypothetical protein